MPLFRSNKSTAWLVLATALVLVVNFFPATFAIRSKAAATFTEYRNISGYGNNQQNPLWGTKSQPLVRLQMPAAYGGNGSGTVMARATGPSARLISNSVLAAGKTLSQHSDNLLHTYFGQLVSLDLIVVARGFGENVPISVPAGDPWKDPTNLGNVTLSFSRSRFSMINGTRAQQNDMTAWLDMSWLYSPDNSTLTLQRSGIKSRGRIRTDFFRNAPFNPVFNTGKWLLGGQDQINKTPTLHAFFHLFGTYHNTIADQYAADHPDWSDETVFQEARAWNIAVYQKIATREYLAATAGRPLPAYTDASGRTSYNPTVTPNIDNFFASAAFRYGHAVTTAHVPRYNDDLNEIRQGSLLVRDSLFNPTTYYIEDSVHGIYNDSGVMKASPHASVFRGCANSLAGKAEASIVDDLRNFMFGGPSNPTTSADLASLNIQRGRDHGIPSFNDARVALGLPRLASWAELTSDVGAQRRLASVYASVDECDPWVCGIAEEPVLGAIVGPTFQASILEQFTRLRNADRFWYEIPGRFTDEEIDEIHGMSLISLMRLIHPDEILSTNSLPASPFFINRRQLNSTTLVQSCSYDALPSSFRSNTVQLAPLMQFSWLADTQKGEITFIIQACVEGWVGIGFDPEPNTMKGADIILCRYFPDTNTHECTDRYALDVGVPSLDTDIGGTDDILFSNVSVNSAGVRRFTITRKLAASDERDHSLGTNPTKFIFAFNPDTTNLLYHGPTRSPSNVFTFVPVAIKLSTGLTAFAGAISILGAMVSIFFFFLVIIKKDYFKYQAPVFCCMIIIGTLFGHASVWAFMTEFSDASCTINVWLINLSFVIVFACLALKTWRMWRVVGNKKLKVTVVTVTDVMKMVGLFLIVELIFLILWTIFDRPQALVVRDSVFGIEAATHHLVCKHPVGFFWYISIAYKAALLLLGVFLTIKVRRLPPIFNDARQVGVSIYVATFTLVILIVISVVLEWSVEATYATRVIGASIPYTLICIVLFGGQLARIWKGRPPQKFSRTVTVAPSESTHSSHGSSSPASTNSSTTPASHHIISHGEIRRLTSDQESGRDTGDDSDDDHTSSSSSEEKPKPTKKSSKAELQTISIDDAPSKKSSKKQSTAKPEPSKKPSKSNLEPKKSFRKELSSDSSSDSESSEYLDTPKKKNSSKSDIVVKSPSKSKIPQGEADAVQRKSSSKDDIIAKSPSKSKISEDQSPKKKGSDDAPSKSKSSTKLVDAEADKVVKSPSKSGIATQKKPSKRQLESSSSDSDE